MAVRTLKGYFCGSCVVTLEKMAATDRERVKLKALCEMRSDAHLCIWCPRCGVFSSLNCEGAHPVNIATGEAGSTRG